VSQKSRAPKKNFGIFSRTLGVYKLKLSHLLPNHATHVPNNFGPLISVCENYI